MPVKKNKKTSEKKTLKRDIKKAVEKLPGLIVERVRLSESQTEKEIPPQTQQEEPRSNKHARMQQNPRQARWLWTGVIIFCLVIFSMWGWNMYVMITDTTEGAGSNSGWLPDPVRDDLRTVWQEVGAPDDQTDENETIKEKIKSDLRGLVAQIKSLPAAVATSTTTTAESL